MKKKDSRTSFTVPIYDFKVDLIITNDMPFWENKFPDNNTLATSECEAMCVTTDGKKLFLVIQPRTPLSCVAHEIGHAARHIMHYIGFRIESTNDEPLAYLEGYLTQRVHDEIKSLTKRKSKRNVKTRRKRH